MNFRRLILTFLAVGLFASLVEPAVAVGAIIPRGIRYALSDKQLAEGVLAADPKAVAELQRLVKESDPRRLKNITDLLDARSQLPPDDKIGLTWDQFRHLLMIYGKATRSNPFNTAVIYETQEKLPNSLEGDGNFIIYIKTRIEAAAEAAIVLSLGGYKGYGNFEIGRSIISNLLSSDEFRKGFIYPLFSQWLGGSLRYYQNFITDRHAQEIATGSFEGWFREPCNRGLLRDLLGMAMEVEGRIQKSETDTPAEQGFYFAMRAVFEGALGRKNRPEAMSTIKEWISGPPMDLGPDYHSVQLQGGYPQLMRALGDSMRRACNNTEIISVVLALKGRVQEEAKKTRTTDDSASVDAAVNNMIAFGGDAWKMLTRLAANEVLPLSVRALISAALLESGDTDVQPVLKIIDLSELAEEEAGRLDLRNTAIAEIAAALSDYSDKHQPITPEQARTLLTKLELLSLSARPHEHGELVPLADGLAAYLAYKGEEALWGDVRSLAVDKLAAILNEAKQRVDGETVKHATKVLNALRTRVELAGK